MMYMQLQQYTAKLDTEKLGRHMCVVVANNRFPRKRYNFRLASEEDNARLSGTHNYNLLFQTFASFRQFVQQFIQHDTTIMQ